MALMFFDETEHVEREYNFDLPPELKKDKDADEPLKVKILGWEKVGGDIVWRGAHLISKALSMRGPALKGVKTIELGAGSGLLGVVAAKFGAYAVITDGDESFMPLLNENATRFQDDLHLGGTVAAAFVEWGTPAAEAATKEPDSLGHLLRRRGFELILGSEIVYMEEHIPELAETIEYFLADGGEALIANTAVSQRTNHPEARRLFFSSLERLGLNMEVQTMPDGPLFAAVGDIGIKWSEDAYVIRITRSSQS